MMENKKRGVVVLGLVLAALMAMSTVAYASLASFQAGKVNAVQVATGSSSSTTASQSWVDLPGSEIVVKVAAGKEKYFLATFSAESRCTRDGGTSGYCPLRILLNGTELAPAVGNDFAFDSAVTPDNADDKWEAHSIQRVIGPVASGTYTMKVQYRTTTADMDFRLDDWVFSVMKAKG